MAGSGSVSFRRRRHLLVPVLVVLSAVSLVAGLLVATGVIRSGWGAAPASDPGNPVAVHQVRGQAVRIPAMPAWHRQPVSWPAAGSGTAVFTAARVAGVPAGRAAAMPAGPTAGSARAGSLPVWAGPPAGSGPTAGSGPVTTARMAPASGAPVSRVSMSLVPQSAAAALGVHGVVFTVTRADSQSAAGRVHVSVDFASFADAYGGGYASRLHLVELPACALATPGVAACRRQVPVVSADDVRVSRVGADVILPGVSASARAGRGGGSGAVLTARTGPVPGALVLAVTASSQGPGGNFAAEPLSEENQWVSGGSSGAYTYSYPVGVPPVPGGLEPSVSLDYDSQTVDGLNASTNNEASWIGDGWTYEPGFIENEYQTCATMAQQRLDTLDLCATPAPEQTITLNGVTTPLVVTSGGGTHPEADGGQQVNQLSSGGYEVIEPDGTQYWFGVNQLPGWSSGNPETNSVWTVPTPNLFGGFVNVVWRYMLDYVVDPHGDAIAYFYNTETNYYAENQGTAGTGQYTRGGVLAKIEYGLRAGNIYSQTPAAQVTFTSAASRQDAPADLACAQGAACTVTAPTFWTDQALTQISTQALAGGTLANVDSWALNQTYPATGDATTSPSLWLSSVTRTGQDGATPVALPPVSFSGTAMANLAAGSPGAGQGNSLITRFRLTSVTNQYGGVTTIGYSAADASCAAGTFPAEDADTRLCYPSYWWTDPLARSYQKDWFNLYDTASVTDTDTTGGDPPVVTSYTYSGPAWHYDKDTLSRSASWTWNQWRGFGSVITETGTAPDPVTETAVTYFQGMSHDDSDSRTVFGIVAGPAVSLTSSHGNVAEDLEQYAGMAFEQITYNGAGTGSQVADTISMPFTSAATGTNSTLSQASYITGTSSSNTYTTLAGGGTRESTISYSYNGYGQVATKVDVPDTADTSQSTTTNYTYQTNTNTSVWIVDLPGEVEVTGGSCGVLVPCIVSDTRYGYDGSVVPAHGDATQVTHVDLRTGQTIQESYTYDQYGRVLTATDGDQRKTTTAYTPATGAEPASVQVTDPAGLITTTAYDPARDLALTVTGPAGDQSAETYDALGRETAAWTAGNPVSGPAVDKYAYAVTGTAPPVTTEQVEEPGGGYLTTDTIGDSFGQPRETQAQTAGGGTDVSDVAYNSDGWKSLTSDPYYVSGAPSGTLVSAASASVPSQTGYVYDGDGRLTRQISYALGSQTWEAGTSYGGNYVTTVPPAGGTSSTTFTDGRGLTTAIYQYHAGVPADPSDPASNYDKTSYTYTPAQKLASITDAAGNTWSYTYDGFNRQKTQTDPDAGTTTSTYDNAGQLMTVTDARGKQVSYTYDTDGRKTAGYDTTGGVPETTADELASWTWDTLALGKLTSSTAFEGGASYTEQVTGYNTQGLPSGDQTVIPSAQGALAGTYTTSYTYAPSGQLTSYEDSAAGGLPDETVTTGYDAAGNPSSLTGASSYVDSLSYTNLGQPLQYTMGTTAEPAYITDTWDPQTGRLTEQNTQTTTAQTSIDDLHYSYDHVGNITSEADTPAGASTAADVQCFQYDYLGRLTQAWAQGSTSCATTPSASAEGGAAPYWNTYAYDVTGNLTGITATTPAGAATATTGSYPAPGSAHPHAITTAKVTTSSGTASTSYGYDPSGNLQTVTGPNQDQTLTWNDAGQLTQDAVTPQGGTAKDTTYLYDAGGTLLITADPGTTTLYLPDEELSLTNGTVTGTRYYSLKGITVAARTGATGLAYLAGDQQDTSSVAIDSATLGITRRYYDPYGNPRGTAPPSFPTGQKGFVGGAADTATSLTDLGARQYQPGTGSFITPDSLLNPYDPRDLNPYGYAKGNPSTDSDPSGQCAVGPSDGPAQTCSAQQVTANPHAYSGAYGCTASTPAAVQACVNARTPPRGSTAPPSCPVVASNCYHDPLINPAHDHSKPPKPAPVRKKAAEGAPDPRTCGPMSIHVGYCINIKQNDLLDWLVHHPSEAASFIAAGICAFALRKGSLMSLCVGGEGAGSNCVGESFTAATKVLLANGKAKPISQLKPGDKVLATNTKTGKTQPEPVAAVLVHHDTDLYDLTVRAGPRTAIIHTTSDHLFWDATTRRWIPANKLSKGEHLKAPGGATVIVVGGTTPKQRDGWMWDLTVPGNNDHDFYVIAGNPGQSKNGDHAYYGFAEVTALLVHNSGGMDGCSEAAYQGVLHIKDEVAKGNMSHDLGMSDNELADYLDKYANSGIGQPLKGGGVGWYDSSRGVMIIQRGKYSMTAFKTSPENFLSRVDPSR